LNAAGGEIYIVTSVPNVLLVHCSIVLERFDYIIFLGFSMRN